ncbi:hypothetical protein [Allobaculum stercoricanis]|uniref:hypothetical protein n=1 Tax=Allobaculum stercoricanis TaxID=174709 RepID=UPI0023F1CE40|nr:hypothetical protein [Allobaculum stercoricanis]
MTNTIFKKLISTTMACAVLFSFTGCANGQDANKELEIKEINMEVLQEMIADKETFTLMVERDNCPFCNSMNTYLEETKADHKGQYNVYRLDTTDYELYREAEGDMTLISSTEEGKQFLSIFPYFLYTPSIYKIEEGLPVDVGIGYDEANYTISNWNVDSTINWEQARPIDVWTYLAQE